MPRGLHWRGKGKAALLCLIAAAAAVVLISGQGSRQQWEVASQAAGRRPTGSPQLVAIERLPMMDGEMCQWMPASASASLSAALQEAPVHRSRDWDTLPPGNADRTPTRIIRDTYPTYSAVAVNLQTDEVFLQDENLFGIKVFDRLDNTPPTAAFTEPKRAIAGGGITKLEFNCGLYVDPRNGDIYSITNDTIDTLTVFPANASGEIRPQRELYTPHGTYGISVDEDAQEMYMTVQHDNAVVVYPKEAEGDDQPIRELVGDRTQIEDPHGIAVDFRNQLMFVSNHGHGRSHAEEFGKFEPASITVYPLQADGDIAPLRIIEGPRTRLNWPASLWVDPERGELYVANDGDNSVLVFKTTDDGNVAPTRMISGPKTNVLNPTGVFLDSKNDELWVSNMGNHSATVFERTADGDVAPKRVIRSAPAGKKALAIGNPGAVAYDSTRDEIMVPN